MAGTTTPWGISYPDGGDQMNPLPAWFSSLASSVNAALNTLESNVAEDDLPDPISGQGDPQATITATAWADLPGMSSLTLTLDQACWVNIVGSAWMYTSAVGTQSRAGISVSGATTLSETQLEVGGNSAAWGAVMIREGAGTAQGATTRFVRLNAGVNTIKMRAYKMGSGTAMVNYSTMQVSPVRWA